MEIYVVCPGDTLPAIARRYGLGARELGESNQLNDGSQLAPGLALAIPRGMGTARREIEVDSCVSLNIPGMALDEALLHSSYICPYTYTLTEEGALDEIEDDDLLRRISGRAGALLVVSNRNASGNYSAGAAHAVFSNQDKQRRLLEEIITIAEEKEYAGVNFNIQYAPSFEREGYNDFLETAAGALHSHGLYLKTSLAPQTSDSRDSRLCAAQDFAHHGRLADRVELLAYDWGFGAPGAISPVDKIRQAIDYACGEIPPGKLLLGISNYGYLWELPWRQGQAPRKISNAAAANIAAAAGANIKINRGAIAPYFSYRDARDGVKLCCFEDVRSAMARLKLVEEYSLAGICIHTADRLNLPLLSALQSLFSVEKPS